MSSQTGGRAAKVRRRAGCSGDSWPRMTQSQMGVLLQLSRITETARMQHVKVMTFLHAAKPCLLSAPAKWTRR
jgi:hypothetical protein